MKKIHIFILFTLVNAFLAQSQTSTEKHITLKGTRFAFVPPTSDFVPRTTSFLGMEDGKNHARIMIVELDANKGELGSISKAQRALMETGKTPISEDKIEVSGIPANLRKVRGLQKMTNGEGFGEMAEFIINELSFVHRNFNIYIYASYLAKDEATLGKAVDESIKNLIYWKDKQLNPLDKLNFNILTEGSKLKPNLVLPTLLQLNVSGTEDGGDEPTYTINQFEATERNIASLGDGNKLIDQDFSSPIISDKKLRLFENQQFKGYEATGIENEVNGNKRLLYLVVLRGEKNVYRIKGETLFDYESFLADFRKLTDSIRE